jgi:hypothetical protein
MESILAQFNINNLGGILEFAGTQSYQGWLSLGVNLLLSTLIGGIVLIIILEILGHEWGEDVHPVNAFFVILVINLINLFGVVGFLSFIPYAALIIPIFVWILLVKAFFSELSFKHATIVGIIGFILTMLLIPLIVNIIGSYLPFG